MNLPLKGIIPPIVTPLLSNTELDIKGLKNLTLKINFLLIIIAVLILLFLYIIDFDLSIFYSK